MRITKTQQHIICETATKYFGSNVQVWLFGSRVNDHTKGGDIDLYIEAQMKNTADLVMAKLLFLRDLHKIIGEQKIDVVIRRPNSSDLPVYQMAKQTGILLQ